jgi:hypothetical protein
LLSLCEECPRLLQFENLGVDLGDNAAYLHLSLLKDGNGCRRKRATESQVPTCCCMHY